MIGPRYNPVSAKLTALACLQFVNANVCRAKDCTTWTQNERESLSALKAQIAALEGEAVSPLSETAA